MNRIFKAGLGCNLLSLAHLFRLELKPFLRACLRSFSATYRSLNIPEITLGEILGERRAEIHFTVTRGEDGALPADQVMVLLAILVAEAPREVLEIGTFMGTTTRQMAENLTTATIHTVDLPEDFALGAEAPEVLPKGDFHLIARRIVGREYRGQPCASRIVQHFGDTATWDYREAGQPTFFFIDGSHTYEYCKKDTEICHSLCHGRGTFLWHDCDDQHPGVVKFLQEWRGAGWDVRRIAGTPIAYFRGA